MNDKKRILKMVEDGKLNADEAINILNALDIKSKENENKGDFFDIDKNNHKGKMLYVRVTSDEDNIKINIPIDFLKIASKSLKNFQYIEKYNIDFDEIISAIDSNFEGRIVDIESKNNEKVIVEIK